jgi:hypothetical protein
MRGTEKLYTFIFAEEADHRFRGSAAVGNSSSKSVAFVAWGTLLVAAAMIALLLLNLRTRQLGGRDLSRLWIPATYLALTGTALVFRKKWAAFALALPLGAVGVWLAFHSMLELPPQWAGANVLIGLVMLAPAIVLYRKRASLR